MLNQISALLKDVQASASRILVEMEELSDRARTLDLEAAADLAELRQFVGLVSMDMGLISGTASSPTLEGHDLRVDAMRQGAAQISVAASRASILYQSVDSLRTVVQNSARHFASEDALTSTFDSTNDYLQIAISEAREVERRRMAGEIHDGPAQVLSNAVNMVDMAEHVAKSNPVRVADELRQLRMFLKEGVDEVRQFMQDLRPTMLEFYGLEKTLERYTGDFCARWGLKWTYNQTDELPPLTAGAELATLRILQESLRNVRKHAGMDVSVAVSLSVSGNEIVMRISDDGKGFDPLLVAPKVSSGDGIIGMRDRAASVHARLTVESQSGAGSTVTFCLPFVSQSES